mgnify:CR=1 FL=1
MNILNGLIQCMAVYEFSIGVPDHLSLEEAIEHAKNHIDEIPLGKLEYVCGSDEIDEDRCKILK